MVGGLAGSVGAEQSNDFAASDFERNAVDRFQRAVTFGQPLHSDHFGRIPCNQESYRETEPPPGVRDTRRRCLDQFGAGCTDRSLESIRELDNNANARQKER